jgi:hypothetical protein
MINHSAGKIFLADERGVCETDQVRSQFTFNSGPYFDPFKFPFGNIYAVNDHLLAGGASQEIDVRKGFHLIILPVAGAVRYKNQQVSSALVAAGQALINSVSCDEAPVITNPFKEEVVNYLEILVRANQIPLQRAVFLSTYDNVNKNRNRLLPLFAGISEKSFLPNLNSIGKFTGRGEAIYHLRKNDTGVFVFVLEGAFEVNGRLLHARDGLALWHTERIGVEALSNDAILLLIETEVDPG